MAKILIIHGAGMNMRGKVQTEIFGPMTLPEYDERIRGYAAELGVEVEIFHSNIEGEIVNKIYEAADRGIAAAIFNPAAFGSGYPALVAALSQVKLPTIEVHIIEHYLARSSTDAGGIGEPATIPTAAAIANAFYNATGVRVRELPITPARVLAALGNLRQGATA